MKEIRVGLVGCGFMGKAHSNAWLNVAKFFPLKVKPKMQVACDKVKSIGKACQGNWGWKKFESSYKKLLKSREINLVDITTPNNAHREIALAAAESGVNIACEKPLAMNSDEAREMLKAVRKSKVKHMIWFNYRRVPAIGLAKRIIEEGRIGKIYHIRASYLQDWIMDPNFPLVWRLQKEITGSGAHGDLNAHIIDIARYLVGEFDEVVGMDKTFIKTRPLVEEAAGLAGRGKKVKGKVTVDDAVLFLARFKNGAIATFESTRFAGGRKNQNQFEINGSRGTLAFKFERMNELQYLSLKEPQHLQGFKTILATEPVHPYVHAWWPPGHILGYEHAFVNAASDLVESMAKNRSIKPNFEDGLKCQQVLDAVLKSAQERTWVKVDEM